MRRLLISLLMAAALIAASCGGDSSDVGDPSAIPTEEATLVATPTVSAEDSATSPQESTPEPSTPEPSPSSTEAGTPAPDPTPTGEPESRPSDPYFALDRVMDISIEIDTDDWDTLRHQGRTLQDVIAEIAEHNFSRPFASIYSWFSATVTVDGEAYDSVGVRKKGFVGSQSDSKPSLKLRFDRYVDDQAVDGVVERMTLNNSAQDPSMINTCMSYAVFAAAGNPAPRCNFATVEVNGANLGLYVHVEEFKAPFLEHHFGTADGNLYEGTVSDFTPIYRGTFEKKTNEDDDDWSDVDAVVAALEDPSDSGLEALGELVDLDRFLSFWATEVLVGHWDSYSGNRNNYWFYRTPDGPFVFLPWGADGTFHLSDDPNPFDGIGNPPPSVLALTAIPNRLYNHPDWRVAYVSRLKEILDTAWDEEKLLELVNEMVAIVQAHALPAEAAAAAEDTERVRDFILKRRGEILADLTPEPPEWPGSGNLTPEIESSGTLEVKFETTWGSDQSPNPLAEGEVSSLELNGSEESTDNTGIFAGYATAETRQLLPGVEDLAAITGASLNEDGSINGMVVLVELSLFTAGATLEINRDTIAGGVWNLPPGGSEPDWFSPFTSGELVLDEAGTTHGAIISGTFSGAYGFDPPPPLASSVDYAN